MECGDTLLIPSGGKHHLFVAIAGPHTKRPHQILLAPVCTYDSSMNHDATCILHEQDHPFLSHDSYVAYNFCRIQTLSEIQNGINSGLIIGREKASTNVLARITAGIYASPETKKFASEFLAEFQ